MALNLLHLALTLLIAAQGTNVTPSLRSQAILVANNAISVAQAEIATESAPAPVFVENRTPPKLLVIPKPSECDMLKNIDIQPLIAECKRAPYLPECQTLPTGC